MVARMPVRRRYLVIQLKRLRREATFPGRGVEGAGWSRAKLQRLKPETSKGSKRETSWRYARCTRLIRLLQRSSSKSPETPGRRSPGGSGKGCASRCFSRPRGRSNPDPGVQHCPCAGAASDSRLRYCSDAHSVDIHGEEEVQRRLEIRAERQRTVLDREEPPMVMAVIDEAAIRRQIGGVETMKAQVRHLLELSERPRIDIQILPFSAGAHAAAGVPFTILGFDGTDAAGSVVYLESHKDGYYLDTDEEIARYRLILVALREVPCLWKTRVSSSNELSPES